MSLVGGDVLVVLGTIFSRRIEVQRPLRITRQICSQSEQRTRAPTLLPSLPPRISPVSKILEVSHISIV